MEFLPALQNGVDDLKPSLFELLSEQQLASLLPPSLRYLLAISTHRYPRYLLPVLNSFDEAYALVMLLVERHFLRTYGGSFTENFYGMKRARVLRVKGGEIPRAQLGASDTVREAVKLGEGDIWKNLAVLVGLPWLKRKFDEGYDVHAAHANLLGPGYNRDRDGLRAGASIKERLMFYYKWFLRNIYPSVNAAYYFSLIVFNMAYLFDGSKYHSPFLWMIGTRIRRLGAADHAAIEIATAPRKVGPARPGEGGSIFSPRNLARSVQPRLLSSLKILLPTSIFALKFLEWWHASDFARQLSRKAAENIDLPPPVLPSLPPAPRRKEVESDEKQRPSTASSEKHQHVNPPISSTTLLPILTVPTPPSSTLCPICVTPITTPTASPTGFVYCYTCIHRWVQGDHERQIAFMEGAAGFKKGDDGDDEDEGWSKEEGSREGRWESGKGRDAVTGRRILGGTEGLRRVVVPPADHHPATDFVNDVTSQMEGFTQSQDIAEECIARDLEEDESEEEQDDESDSSSGSSTVRQFSMINSYRRPSYVNPGARGTAITSSSVPERNYLSSSWKKHSHLSKKERETVREEERSLLRDNNLLPPKHPRSGSAGPAGRVASKMSFSALRKVKSTPDEETAIGTPADERTALLGEEGDRDQPYGGLDTPKTINKKWREAVAAGKINTSWQREAKVLTRSSAPLILTFLLQYSLPVASIFTVGHIGKIELGAVSLASMTASITGYAVYQGLATSLDTLCAQAYGSGRPHLVGLQLQRMLYFLLLITIPISIIWAFGTQILSLIVPEQETARLAGLYLKVLIAGAPGYAAFESGKRYVQAQGIFSATMYILLFCAPLNAFLNWYMVWHLGWGFIGAPIAVSITENILPVLLFLYVRFIDGYQCWGGFDRRALKNWMPMIKLALPGLIMVLAEFLAFEILTLSSSWLGPTELAAQSVLGSITGITFQIPFPMSVAASTRIANLIGATLAVPAKMASKVAIVASVIVGIFNLLLLSLLREQIPRLFTPDPDVIRMVSALLPLCATFQVFDALAANCNGILRGLGRQEIGGYVALFSYYIVGIPISFGTGFGAGWGLWGLWSGPAIALGIVAAIEGVFIYRTSWEKAVEAAKLRNAAG
ncbi:Pex12 amino terminal region-domain-containing protein [Paraphoma chrysanthemicola]|uniref:Peroxisome assembly protein 12 n=1 Tax=Paraphoma chrysanthemicola TaxID=798071 RepID=A0A8K0W057_9PLEO|nr:Pex12 amino terminal region-domain-containing protein [Paraphoma chrysanthemicola]